MKKDFKLLDEALCTRVRLMSTDDSNALYEAIEASESKIINLMHLHRTSYLNESDVSVIRSKVLREARKIERLIILEGASAKDFFTIQKHFRSMVRAASVIGNWMKGSSLAHQIDSLKTEGIELLNSLYEHIKDLEGNEDSRLPGADKQAMKADPGTAGLRDRFMKVYTDFAVLFRGTMALADMFSDDPAQLGGYNDIKSVMASLEREQLMSDPLGDALTYADHTAAEVNPKKGFFGRFGSKRAGLTGTFKNAITKAISSSSPGFSRLVNVNELIDYLLTKSADQLMAVFGRFNDFVASDVDVDYLLSVTKNPRTLGAMFKSIFDAFGSSKPFNVRSR